MLKVERLNVYYGESHILRDVDLDVPPGKVVCLMGRNGVGKTTLLKSIMGLLAARSGRLLLPEVMHPSRRLRRAMFSYRAGAKQSPRTHPQRLRTAGRAASPIG